MDRYESLLLKQIQTNGARNKLLMSSQDFGSKLCISSLGCTTTSICPPSNYSAKVLRDNYFS